MLNDQAPLPPSSVKTARALHDALRPLGQALSNGVLNLQAYRHGFLGLLRDYLDCSRVSLWRFRDADLCLVCRASVDADGTDLLLDSELSDAQYHAYFERVMKLGVFACNDTHAEPAVDALREPYLDPQNVRALLDVSFGVNGRLYGVLCCEQNGEPREWTREESTTVLRFVRTVSLQVARVLPDVVGEMGLAARDLAR